MEKYCKKCDTTKPVSEFHKNAAKKDGLTLYCRQCNNRAGKEWSEKNPDYRAEWRKKKSDYSKDYSAEWRRNNPDYHKEWREKNPDKVKEYEERRIPRTYGITIEHYNDLLDQQNNRCAICRGENKDGRALSVDHDHSCCKGKKSCGECVRQLLCVRCNSMLGYARDNIEILKAAQNYLERHSRPEFLAKKMNS